MPKFWVYGYRLALNPEQPLICYGCMMTSRKQGEDWMRVPHPTIPCARCNSPIH